MGKGGGTGGAEAEEFLGVQRPGDPRGHLVNGAEVLDLGLQVRLGLLQVAAKDFDLQQSLFAVPDLLPEGGDFPRVPRGHGGRKGQENPRLAGKDPAGPRKTLPRPPIGGPEDLSVKKQVERPAEDQFPPDGDPVEGAGPTMAGREQTAGKGGYRG